MKHLGLTSAFLAALCRDIENNLAGRKRAQGRI